MCLFFCASNPLNLNCIRCKIKESQLLRLMFSVCCQKQVCPWNGFTNKFPFFFFLWFFNAAALNRNMGFMPIFSFLLLSTIKKICFPFGIKILLQPWVRLKDCGCHVVAFQTHEEEEKRGREAVFHCMTVQIVSGE